MRLSRLLMVCLLLLLAPRDAFAAEEGTAEEAKGDAQDGSERNLKLASLLAQINAVQVEKGAPFLWRVTSRKKKARAVVWITGSVHLGRPEMYPLDPAIEQAFLDSQKLAVEMDISDPAAEKEMGKQLMALGTLPEGQTMKTVFPERYEELKIAFWTFGIPMMLIERQTPFLAAMTLSVSEMIRAGWDPNLGIDKHFLSAARAGGKEVVELEGLERQLQVFRDMPMGAQLAMLEATLDMVGGTHAWTSKAWEALRAGDTDAMAELQAIDEPEADSDYADFDRVLLDERNAEMAKKLLQHALRGEDAMFVVVGALHVPGHDGLIDLLSKDKRLRVTRVGRE